MFARWLEPCYAIQSRPAQGSKQDEFWYGLLEIAAYKKMPVPALVAQIDNRRKIINLSSAIRIFVFNYFQGPVRKRKRSLAKKKTRS